MRAVALIAALFAASAFAQLRTIPGDAKRATMSHVQERIVELDGRRETLAPGVRIRDAGSLVKYRRDASGAIREVWILTPEEAAQR